jgi:hypothetical protein
MESGYKEAHAAKVVEASRGGGMRWGLLQKMRDVLEEMRRGSLRLLRQVLAQAQARRVALVALVAAVAWSLEMKMLMLE